MKAILLVSPLPRPQLHEPRRRCRFASQCGEERKVVAGVVATTGGLPAATPA
jgi:hypothetical protein